MFCKNCGNELKDGVKFCSKCGSKIEIDSKTDSETLPQLDNITAGYSSTVSRDTYIGKAYTFDYYIGVNLQCLRISRRAVGFNDDNLLYCKGLRKTQIPYNMIKEIKDETKISAYAIFCIVVLIMVGIICIACGGAGYAIIAAILAVLAIVWRKCRQISITTTDNKVFKVKIVPKNKEIDQFLIYLKNEAKIV
ncbi:MAG: zinc ribbon domain-containing protein [Ruminococcus flavefaciens]|nr:zinc ribbon domain-containing protein [Ruminococcus flavefaciens]MCM1061458.1 zinc ribbon domain-containing protein [Eubacterium sp.]